MKSAELFIENANILIGELNNIIGDENFGKRDISNFEFGRDRSKEYEEEDRVRLLYMRIKAMLGEYDNGKAFLEELSYITKSTADIASRFAFSYREKDRMNIYKNVLQEFIKHVKTYRVVDTKEVHNN